MQLGSVTAKVFVCRVMAIASLGLCSLWHPLSAQIVTADIVGTVADSTGGSLANVKVTAQNVDTELTRTVQTDSTGGYQLTLLPIGRYQVTAEAAGFKTAKLPEITLAQGDRARVDIRM